MNIKEITDGHTISPLTVRHTTIGSFRIEPSSLTHIHRQHSAIVPDSIHIRRDHSFSHALALAYNETFVRKIDPKYTLMMRETLLAIKNNMRAVEGKYCLEMDCEEFEALKRLLNDMKLK